MMAGRASIYALLAAIATTSIHASAADRAAEPNTQVPAGSMHYVADGFPDRIVATPPRTRPPGLRLPGAPMPASRGPGWNWWSPAIRRMWARPDAFGRAR